MRRCFRYTILTFFTLAFTWSASAYVELPGIISDNMVLQQNDRTRLWGKAEPGNMVVVSPSWSGEQYSVPADGDGNWSLEIETPAAGGPYSIKFDDGQARTIKNIMIGEVWLCSGQSNMEMPLGSWGKVNDYEREIQTADHPMIRILKVKKSINAQPQADFVSNSMGWQECSPATVGEDFSAAAYFFARNLREQMPDIAIGLVDATWGGTVVESWTSAQSVAQIPEFADTLKRYRSLSAETPLKDPNKPTLLFNAMIHPLLPFAFRGVIWYQGESNNRRAYQYRELFPLMIEDWRTQFGRADMPFIYVQLAGYMAASPEPQESNWAELREAQSMALKLPNTGMAVAIDIGEEKDIHPKNKQEVGRRLARIALGQVYGKELIYRGPVYRDFEIDADKVVLRFEDDNAGLTTACGGKLKGFAIAGSNRMFYWADARINGNTVVVSSEYVRKPIAVRYAWANNPVCNLVNGEGLPASPFRTDDWPGLTINIK